MILSRLLFVAALAWTQESGKPVASTRRHDVDALLSLRGKSESVLDLCPQHELRAEPEQLLEHRQDEATGLIDGDELCALLGRIARAQGAELEIALEGGALRVTASEATHAEIERLLALLRTALLGEERIEVRAIAGDDLAGIPRILDQEEADRREREIVASGHGSVRRIGSTALIDGRVTTIEDVTSRSYVRDFEVEICHGSVIYDPVVGNEKTGITASVRSARLQDATWLDLAIRHSEQDLPVQERLLEPKVWFASPFPHDDDSEQEKTGLHPAAFHGTIPLRLQFPRIRFLSCAGTFIVPNGKALWIPCRVATQEGPVSFALEVRVRGHCRPPLQSLGGDTPSVERMLLHVASLQGGGLAAPRMELFGFETGVPGFHMDRGWWPSVVASTAPNEDPIAAVREVLTATSEGSKAKVEWLSSHHLLVEVPRSLPPSPPPTLPPNLINPMAPGLTGLVSGAPTVELRGRILRDAKPLAEFRIPATIGGQVSIWSGIEGSYLADWDVDVADEASCGNPEISSFLDGFALSFTLRPVSPARAQIDVNGVLTFLAQPPKIESLVDPYTPSYEKLNTRRLVLEETRYFAPSGPATTLRFGGALELELTLDSP